MCEKKRSKEFLLFAKMHLTRQRKLIIKRGGQNSLDHFLALEHFSKILLVDRRDESSEVKEYV